MAGDNVSHSLIQSESSSKRDSGYPCILMEVRGHTWSWFVRDIYFTYFLSVFKAVYNIKTYIKQPQTKTPKRSFKAVRELEEGTVQDPGIPLSFQAAKAKWNKQKDNIIGNTEGPWKETSDDCLEVGPCLMPQGLSLTWELAILLLISSPK
jgi:hypothetical protein